MICVFTRHEAFSPPSASKFKFMKKYSDFLKRIPNRCCEVFQRLKIKHFESHKLAIPVIQSCWLGFLNAIAVANWRSIHCFRVWILDSSSELVLSTHFTWDHTIFRIVHKTTVWNSNLSMLLAGDQLNRHYATSESTQRIRAEQNEIDYRITGMIVFRNTAIILCSLSPLADSFKSSDNFVICCSCGHFFCAENDRFELENNFLCWWRKKLHQN